MVIFSRLHAIYGALRMISLITDMFVIYHAKGLKLTHSEAEGKGGGEDGDEKAETEFGRRKWC